MLISCQRQQNKQRLPWPQGVYWAEAKKESASAAQKGVSRVFHSGLNMSAEASTFRNYDMGGGSHRLHHLHKQKTTQNVYT